MYIIKKGIAIILFFLFCCMYVSFLFFCPKQRKLFCNFPNFKANFHILHQNTIWETYVEINFADFS